MPKNLSPEMNLYLEILFTLLFVFAAWLVHAALRRAVIGSPTRAPKPWARFFAHLSFPLALLAVCLLTRWHTIRDALPLRPTYLSILDSAFVFFVLIFLIRLVDAAIRLSFELRAKPFPVPRVLHGFILIIIYLALVFTILDRFLKVDIKPLLAGSAILTAVIGLALQGV